MINGVQASDKKICTAFKTIEQARGNTALTYFEFSTLAALLIFTNEKVDIAVLEIGLGGRLDSVNVVDSMWG
ncbi:Dihydrofolate synthase (EC @ Folylpolyglutamate synthase (EC [uncultured Gammaproteobacteria bacterium]|nr:Dihydrofolate synthase (EC @ Folylpolyglutamate synthase (EC [uncultured Gammaproteobacteria bacterium]